MISSLLTSAESRRLLLTFLNRFVLSLIFVLFLQSYYVFNKINFLASENILHGITRPLNGSCELINHPSILLVNKPTQVLDHCKRAPETSRNCCAHTEDLCYVDTWVVKDERARGDGDKQRHGEKMRHDELLAKIQLAWEFEPFSLCRIDNFFFYSLDEENEERDSMYGREILSAQSSISSMGSRPSHNRSSSSSFPDDIPVSVYCSTHIKPKHFCVACWAKVP